MYTMCMMNERDEKTTNPTKLARVAAAWRVLVVEACRPGFYGTAALEVTIQDGIIQSIRRRLERVEK